MRVSLEGVEWMDDDLDFNPFPFGERVVGFAMRGERVVPVIDAKTLGKRRMYLHTGRSVVLVRYDAIERGKDGLRIREIEEEVLRDLGGV